MMQYIFVESKVVLTDICSALSDGIWKITHSPHYLLRKALVSNCRCNLA